MERRARARGGPALAEGRVESGGDVLGQHRGTRCSEPVAGVRLILRDDEDRAGGVRVLYRVYTRPIAKTLVLGWPAAQAPTVGHAVDDGSVLTMAVAADIQTGPPVPTGE